jgi:Ca-activated chloride channel homolog
VELLNLLQQLHFIRPYWLLALIPAALLIWLYSTTQLKSRNWASIIDPRLLPHLLKGTTAATPNIKNKTPSSLLLFAVASCLIISLAGPAFEKRPQPVFKAQSALVIVLDLSRSMDAGDTKPSRLSRAHFKINDILKQRKEGQTALIVYAADAYAVSPLTDDAATIAAQIPALDTNIMPAQGSRLDIALDKAVELFTNAGHAKGDIFILSDSASQADINKAGELNAQGFASSVLAIGTEQGAPINAAGGGFIKDSTGSIVVPKLDSAAMRKLALAGGGKFTLLSADDRDINRLLSRIDIDKSGKNKDEQLDASGNKFKTDTWHEEGPWLLLLVIPFAAYAFRRGMVFALLIFILPLPQPAQALEWNELWKNKDQLGQAALQQGDSAKAAELFNNPEWKAAAEYKAGNYEQAIEQLNNINTADAHYNRGNALAKAGQLDEAIKAYNRAIELQTDHEDAKHNRDLVEKAKQQNKQQSSDNKDGEQQEQKKQDSDQQNQQSQQGDSQDSKDNSQQSQDQKESSDDKQSSSSAENNKQDADKDTDKDSQKNTPQNKTQEESDADKEQAKKQAPEQQAKDEQEKAESASSETTEELDLDEQQTQQWLKKIPDDPGGLLRRKFQYQYGREKHQNEKQPW